MTKEQEVVRSVFDAYIRDIKAVSDKDRPTVNMLEEVKNRAIKALEQQSSNEDVQRVVDYLLKPISKPPTTSKDCVSLGVYKQVVWERDIAIEQLKELGYSFGEKIRTSDDCVSRAEVLEMFGYETTIYDLPPVTPTQRWIPVSERLPKEGETVLVCYQSQGGVAQSVCEWFDMPNRGIVWSTLCGQKPIAWQPLPKPYEEKRGNEK